MSNVITPSGDSPESSSFRHSWKMKVLFCFLALMIESVLINLVPFSLDGIRDKFQISQDQAGMIGTWRMAGMVIGGVAAGFISDRIGRQKVLVVSLIACSALNVALAFIDNFTLFTALRAVSGIFMSGIFVGAIALASEVAPEKIRKTIVTLCTIGLLLGGLVTVALSSTVIGKGHPWEMMFQIMAVGIVLGILMPVFCSDAAEKKKAANAGEMQNPIKVLFANKKSTRILILWILVAGFSQLVFLTLSYWFPEFMVGQLEFSIGERDKYMAIFIILSMVSAFSAGVLADKFGSRVVFVAYSILSAIVWPFIAFGGFAGNFMVWLIVASLIMNGSYGIMSAYIAESFPAEIRGVALGSVVNIGKVMALFGPVAVGMLITNVSFMGALIFMSACFVLAGVFALFIPSGLYKDAAKDPAPAEVK